MSKTSLGGAMLGLREGTDPEGLTGKSAQKIIGFCVSSSWFGMDILQ